MAIMQPIIVFVSILTLYSNIGKTIHNIVAPTSQRIFVSTNSFGDLILRIKKNQPFVLMNAANMHNP